MSADDPIRVVLADHSDERSGVEFVEEQPAFFILPRLVELVIHPTEDLRSSIDEINVRLTVKTAKERIGKFQHILVPDLDGQLFDLKCLFERLGSRRVTVADRSG